MSRHQNTKKNIQQTTQPMTLNAPKITKCAPFWAQKWGFSEKCRKSPEYFKKCNNVRKCHMLYIVSTLNQCLDICHVFCCMLCLVKFLDSLLTTPSTCFIYLIFLRLDSSVQNWKFLKVASVVRKEPKKWGSTCQSNVPILDAKGVIKLSKKVLNKPMMT